jgi:hypothetical protein
MELALPSRNMKVRPKEVDNPSQKGNAKALSKLLQDVTTMRRARVSVWQRWLVDTLAAAEKDAALLLRAGIAQDARSQGPGRQPRLAITDQKASDKEPEKEEKAKRASACVNEVKCEPLFSVSHMFLEAASQGNICSRMLLIEVVSLSSSSECWPDS